MQGETAHRSPGLGGVLETALYHAPHERRAIQRFYGQVLGLRSVAAWDDGIAFRVGAGVLLLFDRTALEARSGPIAEHGSTGPGHACLLAPPGDYDACRRRLAKAGVEIVHDQRWGDARRSFYFRDPAGNLLEVADGDLWPP